LKNINKKGGEEMKKKLLVSLVVLTGMLLMSASMVWAQPAPVAKTGQTTCYGADGSVISCAGTGQDGDLQKGVAWPSPRFTDNGDETVTDNLTGLMWTKNANLNNEKMNWSQALSYANNLSLGNAGCGTSYTDWRLPNRNELNSLADVENQNFALPRPHPFYNMQYGSYWSSTTAFITSTAWTVNIQDSNEHNDGKDNIYGHVRTVRGGN
jgi:hypothetical protein